MNKTPRDFSREQVGKILSKEKRKVYDKKSEFYGNTCYRLKITNEEKKEENILFVYSNLVSAEIFRTIEQSNYVDKRYLFFCEERKRGLVLHNWRELVSNPAFFHRREQKLEHAKET